MVTRSQKVRLGVFIVLASVALLATIAVIVAPKIFEVRDTYYVGFRDVSVTGLQDGGPVKYQGLTVGYVKDIFIDPNDIKQVVVELNLDHGTPIKEDSRAEMTYLGITGLKVIEIQSGSIDSDFLEQGSFIKSGKGIADAITGSAEVIAAKAEVVMNNLANLTDDPNREKIMRLVENLATASARLNVLLGENNQALTRTFSNIEDITGDLKEITSSTKNTMTEVEAIAQSDSMKQIVGNLADITDALKKAELIQLIREMNQALHHTTTMLREAERTFSKTNTDLVYFFEWMKQSADYFNEFARMISEDPSVLVRGAEPKDAPDFDLKR